MKLIAIVPPDTPLSVLKAIEESDITIIKSKYGVSDHFLLMSEKEYEKIKAKIDERARLGFTWKNAPIVSS